MSDVQSRSFGVTAPPIRFDTPMQEPISIDLSRVHGNGTGLRHAMPSASPDPPSAGFTAVNGTKPRSASFRQEDSTKLASAPSDNGPKLPSPPSYMSYHAHGWRPATDYSPAPNESQQRESPITGKRKWREQSSGQDGEGAHMSGYRVEQRPTPDRRLTTLDSAVDLTSPENPSQPAPLERNDSDSSEGAQIGTYQREKSPVERWNRGEPPPKPRPEIEASLAASLHQFQQQNQQVQDQQARAPSADRYSPPDEEDDAGEQQGASDDQYHGESGDPKRRKRNFSNRTKTGCHTCRSRKKKCDEGKPTCQNCERGNFVCAGYGTKPPGGTKPTQNRTMIPLQSKAPMPTYVGRMNDAPPRTEEGRSYSHWGRIPPPEPDPPRQYIPVAPADPRRPGTAENWQKSVYHPPEPIHPYQAERPPPPPNFSQPPPPPPPLQPPYNPDHRPHSQLSHYPPPHQPPPPPLQHHLPPQQPLPPPQSRHPVAPPPLPMTLEPWGHHSGLAPYQHHAGPPSQMSSRDSVHSSSHRSGPFYGSGQQQQVEKDNMLRGKPFLHYLDHLLLGDREACRTAVERYNKAAEMTSGISKHERGKLFTQILKPDKRPDNKMREQRHVGPDGTIGDHTIVESPFGCEYGYNIHIGKDCVVESGAYFQDAAAIAIGNRVMIGHNVRLYCITADLQPAARQGSKSRVYAGAIKIEDDCFIGADVLVLPFVTIGKGAVVGAGSVVTKDVEEKTVVAGNPAKLVRRIEGSNMNRHHSQQIQRQQELMQAWMTSYAANGFTFYSSPRLDR